MITAYGYTLSYYKKDNIIIIDLPPTRLEVDDSELMATLLIMKYLFGRKEDEG